MGLVLHNGSQYADTQGFCRQAIDSFSSGRFQRETGDLAVLLTKAARRGQEQRTMTHSFRSAR